MINLRNSCGGTGCNTPEHEKRTGTDSLRRALVHRADRSLLLENMMSVREINQMAYEAFGEGFEDVAVGAYVNLGNTMRPN